MGGLIAAWCLLFVGVCLTFAPNRARDKILLWLLGVQIVLGVIALAVAAAAIGPAGGDQLLLGLAGSTIVLAVILILAFVARRWTLAKAAIFGRGA